MIYNLTQAYIAGYKSSSSFNKFVKRTLHPYAITNGHSVYSTRGGNDGSQGTFTTSIECYNLTLDWINPNSKITFKREELQFEQDILKNLFKGYEILPQYKCCQDKYIIDWYIPSLNLAIEFDEPGHYNNLETDFIRQREIEIELKCKFLRYNYEY